MNYRALCLMPLVILTVSARYEDIFARWEREMDEIHDKFNRNIYTEEISASFSLEKSDKAVTITVDTGKKVTTEDIEILHKDRYVTVVIKGLDRTLNLSLEASKNMLSIEMCSDKSEKKSQENYNTREQHAYYGSSCMHQVLSARVDLAGITAAYNGTKLVLSVPVVAQEQGRKIPVTVAQKEKSVPVQKQPVLGIDEK